MVPELRLNIAKFTGLDCLFSIALDRTVEANQNADRFLENILGNCEDKLKESTFEKCAQKREAMYCQKILSNKEALSRLLAELSPEFEKELIRRLFEKVSGTN